MTKVQLTFKLSRALADSELNKVAHVHAVYGIFAVRITATGNEMFVEYDASRLSPKEVRGTLEENGIPLA